MTESCHFNDKNSLGGSFCIWKGGSIMATTRIMPLHVGKAAFLLAKRQCIAATGRVQGRYEN